MTLENIGGTTCNRRDIVASRDFAINVPWKPFYGAGGWPERHRTVLNYAGYSSETNGVWGITGEWRGPIEPSRIHRVDLLYYDRSIPCDTADVSYSRQTCEIRRELPSLSASYPPRCGYVAKIALLYTDSGQRREIKRGTHMYTCISTSHRSLSIPEGNSMDVIILRCTIKDRHTFSRQTLKSILPAQLIFSPEQDFQYAAEYIDVSGTARLSTTPSSSSSHWHHCYDLNNDFHRSHLKTAPTVLDVITSTLTCSYISCHSFRV